MNDKNILKYIAENHGKNEDRMFLSGEDAIRLGLDAWNNLHKTVIYGFPTYKVLRGIADILDRQEELMLERHRQSNKWGGR